MNDINYICRGKRYDSVNEAIDEYIREFDPGVNIQKLDRIVKAINLDILSNLSGGVTYLKTPVAPLAPSTIRRKGHNTPFLDKGILFNSIKDEVLNEHHGIVFVADDRDLIGFRLNEGTKFMPKRPFFEISEQVLKTIDSILLED